MTDLVKVTQAQIELAWHFWLDFHYGLDCEKLMDRFFNLLDPEDSNEQMISPWEEAEGEFVEVLPDIAARLNMLTGPHRDTYIKAYYANHPWK